jgi:alkylation response protein AidB-like acyl-CoA dehydrogenase
MGAGFAAQLLGIARTSMDTLLGIAGTKTDVESGVGLRNRPAVQALIARRGTALEAARSHLHRCVAALWAEAEAGTPSLEPITAVWGAAHHAMDVAKGTVEDAYAACGTTSLYADCPLERAHRDLHAMLRHVVAQSVWVEDAGRVRLGMAPTHPQYAL